MLLERRYLARALREYDRRHLAYAAILAGIVRLPSPSWIDGFRTRDDPPSLISVAGLSITRENLK